MVCSNFAQRNNHNMKKSILFAFIVTILCAINVQGQEKAVKFQEVILRLSDKQRVIFNLRYYDEMDYQQISKVTDTKVATLKVTYHYIKEKIKKQMVEE
jgi:RNA polymerase sigma factor (sigma-70 family)